MSKGIEHTAPVRFDSREEVTGKKAERLQDATHDIANMMRAYLNKYNLDERINVDLSGSEKEYEAAFQAIEELRMLAESEPGWHKVLYKFGRLLHNLTRIPGGLAMGLDIFLYGICTHTPPGMKKSITRQPDKMGLAVEGLKELDREFSDKLSDAAKRLRLMQKRGKRFGKAESDQGITTKEKATLRQKQEV